MWNYELEICYLQIWRRPHLCSLINICICHSPIEEKIYWKVCVCCVAFDCFVKLVLRSAVSCVGALEENLGWLPSPIIHLLTYCPIHLSPLPLLPHHKHAEYLQCTPIAVPSKKWYSAKHWLSFYIFLSNHCPRKKNFFWSSTMLKQWLLTFCYWPPIGKQANISPK